jgi:phosphoribosyl 1,2-cyclic phosphodiesterase
MAEAPLEAHLFFTHSHWDRIQGFPFFKPAFVEGNSFHIYGGLAVNGASIKQRLMDQMVRPNFPVPLHLMAADLQFHNIVPGETIELEPGIQIETCPLNPSERALGYRISWQDQTVVYATDVDCHPDSPDPALLYLARQANLLIYDTAQAEQDYGVDKPTDSYAPAWQKGIDVAKAASVEQLALFHHDPCHGDAWLEPMEEKVQSLFGAACFAREGMVVDLLPQMA